MASFRVNFDADDQLQVNFDSGGPGDMALSFGNITRVVANDYEQLVNRPSIENVELVGDKSFEQLGLTDITNSEIEAIFR